MFTNMIIHDLRNPTSQIKYAVEMALERLQESRNEDIQKIKWISGQIVEEALQMEEAYADGLQEFLMIKRQDAANKSQIAILKE